MNEGYYLVYIDKIYDTIDEAEHLPDFRFYSIIWLNNNSVYKISIIDEEYVLGSKYSIYINAFTNVAQIESYSTVQVVDGLKKIDNNALNDIPSQAFKFMRSLLDAGQKYSNIYRPLITKRVYNFLGIESPTIYYDKIIYADDEIVNEKDYFDRINHLEILIDELKNIFRTVYADSNNLNTFGHNIRNLIILAATEVDDIMKNILFNNGIKKRRYTTKDYHKLLNVLKLDKYSVKFSRYFVDKTFSPFKGWIFEKPSESIKWYYSYNSLKHDRTKSFKLATIENAILSVCAVAILIVAQYGYRNNFWKQNISTFLSLIEEPNWDLEHFYIPLGSGRKDTLINYPFDR